MDDIILLRPDEVCPICGTYTAEGEECPNCRRKLKEGQDGNARINKSTSDRESI